MKIRHIYAMMAHIPPPLHSLFVCTPMPNNAALASIRQLCSLGLDSHVLMPRVLALLHQIIPSKSNVFFWLGQDGDVCDLYDENAEAYALLPLYISDFVNNREKDVFDGWQHSARFLQAVDQDQIWRVDRKQFMQSAFYLEFLGEVGYHWGLHRPIRAKGCCRGILQMHRGQQGKRFTAQEARQLDELAQFIEYAFASPGAVASEPLASSEPGLVEPGLKQAGPKQAEPSQTTPGQTTPGRTTPGRTTPGRAKREQDGEVEQSWYENPTAQALLISNQHGVVQHVSAEAERLILLASGGLDNHQNGSSQAAQQSIQQLTTHALPTNLLSVIKQLKHIQAGKPASTPSLWVDNQWGRFHFHGQFLCGKDNPNEAQQDELFAIQIEHFLPLRLALLDKLQSAALSARQSELSLEICTEQPYAQIAKKMNISLHTLVSHKRELFRKLNVSNRHELKNTIMAL